MKKKLFALIIFELLFSAACFAEIVFNAEYQVLENGFVIKQKINEYQKYDTIVIPDSLPYKPEVLKPVVSIDKSAFENCTTLKHIVLPKHLKKINQNAFKGCTALATIHLPNSITTIGDNAFANCTSLDSIIIPNKITELNYKIFQNCTNLKYVELPNSLTSVPRYLFSGCSSLESIVLPDNYTSIDERAFFNCTNLKHIKFSDNLKTIGNYAFANCTSLDSIVIPNSITKLGDNVFQNCTNLKQVILPHTINTIPKRTFYRCSSLDSITIPENYTQIDISAFAFCLNLSYIKFSDNLKTIQDSAFFSCKKIKRITLPDSLISINSYGFAGCSELDSVILPNFLNKILKDCFSNCSSLSYIKLNDNLNCNLISTFKNTKISGLEIPPKIQSLYSSSIDGCKELRYITMLGGPIECWCTSAFCGSHSGLTYIYNIIPTGTDYKYQNTFIKSRYYPQYKKHECWGEYNYRTLPIDSLVCNFFNVKKFTIPYSYHADTLLLLQGRDASSSKFDIVQGATYYADNGIGVHFQIDNKRFYYFSLPFNCAINDIRKTNNVIPTFGKDFIIKKHAGDRVAKYGHESTISSNKDKYGWVTLNADDTLCAGQGYIIATSTPTKETYYFITHDSIQLHYANSYSSEIPTPLHNVQVTYHKDNSTNPAYHGWNLISSGLLYDISNHDLYLNDKKINYISIPDSIGKKYYQYEVSDALILPYRSFLVQVSDTGIISFRKSEFNITTQYPNNENRIVISLNSASSQLDKTTFKIHDDYSTGYEYNKDLMKLIGSDCPQIYSISEDINLCYNALPDSALFEHITIGLNIPDTTQYYNISLYSNTLDNNKYILQLVDNSKNITINLNEAINYTFKANNQKEEGRFEIFLTKKIISAEEATNINTINWYVQGEKLYLNNIEDETPLNIYSTDGKLILYTKYHNGLDINTLPKGIYIIRTLENIFKIAL